MEQYLHTMPSHDPTMNNRIARRLSRMKSSESKSESDFESREFFDWESDDGQRHDSFKSITNQEETKDKEAMYVNISKLKYSSTYLILNCLILTFWYGINNHNF